MPRFIVFLLLGYFLGMGCSPQITGDISDYYRDGIPNGSYRIFVTSTTQNGNLGGRSGANAICSARAGEAGLSLEYLSSVSADGLEGLAHFPNAGSLYTVSSSNVRHLVTSSISLFWEDSPQLLHAPRYNEYGVALTGVQAWSGTDTGTINCQNWSTSNAGQNGVAGNVDSTSSWRLSSLVSCDNSLHLYCIGYSPE